LSFFGLSPSFGCRSFLFQVNKRPKPKRWMLHYLRVRWRRR
jgi:hypothetical protein